VGERAEGQRSRARHEIARLRACVESLALNVDMDGSSLEAARAVADTAVSLVATIAALDAYKHAEGA
jgi:hypothetical protein